MKEIIFLYFVIACVGGLGFYIVRGENELKKKR